MLQFLNRFKLWILGAGILAVILLLCVFICHRPEQRLVIAKGAFAHAVAQELKDQKLILHPWIYLMWAKVFGTHGAARPGVYWVKPSPTGYRLFETLRHGPPLTRVTFPEGWTAKQMAALLESRGITPAAEFLTQVEKGKREGTLFPDTYFFEQGLDPNAVINRMVERFHQEEPKDMIARAKAMQLSYRQIIVLASLVEREARAPQERAVIAGVFYNRLKKHWRLESCATVEYALGARKPQLTYKDLEVNSPYNTYKHFGLPPGPICNPGKAALDAAAHPATTDMMFFVSDGKGTHRFSRYYEEHLAVQKQNPKK